MRRRGGESAHLWLLREESHSLLCILEGADVVPIGRPHLTAPQQGLGVRFELSCRGGETLTELKFFVVETCDVTLRRASGGHDGVDDAR